MDTFLQELIGGSSGNNRIVQEAVQNRIIARYILEHIYLAISLIELAVDPEEGNQEIYYTNLYSSSYVTGLWVQ